MRKNQLKIFFFVATRWQVINAYLIWRSLSAIGDTKSTIICSTKYGEDGWQLASELNFGTVVLMDYSHGVRRRLSAQDLELDPGTGDDQDVRRVFFSDFYEYGSGADARSIAAWLGCPWICYEHGAVDQTGFQFSWRDGWIRSSNCSGDVPSSAKGDGRWMRNLLTLLNCLTLSRNCLVAGPLPPTLRSLVRNLRKNNFAAFASLRLRFSTGPKTTGDAVRSGRDFSVGSLLLERVEFEKSYFAQGTGQMDSRQPSVILLSSGALRSKVPEVIDRQLKVIHWISAQAARYGYRVAVKLKAGEDSFLADNPSVVGDWNHGLNLKIGDNDLLVVPVDSVACIECALLGRYFITYNIFDGVSKIGETNATAGVPCLTYADLQDGSPVNFAEFVNSAVDRQQVSSLAYRSLLGLTDTPTSVRIAKAITDHISRKRTFKLGLRTLLGEFFKTNSFSKPRLIA